MFNKLTNLYIKRILYYSFCLQLSFFVFLFFVQMPIVLYYSTMIPFSMFEIFLIICLEILNFYSYIIFFSMLTSLMIVYYQDFVKNNLNILFYQIGLNRKYLINICLNVIFVHIFFLIFLKLFVLDKNKLLYQAFTLIKKNFFYAFDNYKIFNFPFVEVVNIEKVNNSVKGVFVYFYNQWFEKCYIEYINVFEIVKNQNIVLKFMNAKIFFNDEIFFINADRIDFDFNLKLNLITDFSFFAIVKTYYIYFSFLILPFFVHNLFFEQNNWFKTLNIVLFFLLILKIFKIYEFNFWFLLFICLTIWYIYIREKNVKDF